MRLHSDFSQYQHNITDNDTTDRTQPVRQLTATQTIASPIPPNAEHTNNSCVSRHCGPACTSATPLLQSLPPSQSYGSDHPQKTTVVSESLLPHQSGIVENVINKNTTLLSTTISDDLSYFSNKFIELDVISRDASDNILSKNGIGNGEKGSQLLKLVIVNCRISQHKLSWFDKKFICAFSSKAAYKDLATRMTRDLNELGGFRYRMSHSPSTIHTLPCDLNPLVKYFTDNVKTVYRKSVVERQTSVVKWPPTPSKVYINLVCIDRHSVSAKSRIYGEITEAMVRDGNVDAIVNVTKEPIDFSGIARNIVIPNGRDNGPSDEKKDEDKRLILVEGAPGVGKSTFALEFCRRWEKGEIAQQYQLVLLLRLREERISNAKTLEDLIYHALKDVVHAVCHELVVGHDLHALIILEGFDELPDISRKGGSVFIDLIAGKLLPIYGHCSHNQSTLGYKGITGAVRSSYIPAY